MYRYAIVTGVSWMARVVAAAFLPGMLQGQAVLHGVGDLPGGIVMSEMRDATRVGGVIYAVGSASGNAGSTGMDTAVLWTSTGGLRAIPNLVSNATATTFVTASAITPDGAYIASRTRDVAVGGSRKAARVTTTNLQTLLLTEAPGFTGPSSANAISDDGRVLYGFGNGNNQAVRYTADGVPGVAIPFLNPVDTSSIPAARGVSADGSVVVGTSGTNGLPAPGHRAFRYVHGIGLSAIPLLPGGSWNSALELTADGATALVVGNSSNAPQGEAYLHVATNGVLKPLGTPSGNVFPGSVGGLSADGQVALVSFAGPFGGAYFHNASGWHEVYAAALRAGADLTGWTSLFAQGVSPDGTLVFGRGVRNGNAKGEGFVLEFPAGYLAAYTEPSTFGPPNQAIVGGWSVGDPSAEGAYVIFFFPNGYFVAYGDADPAAGAHAVDGFERGRYTWDAATRQATFVTLQDLNGDIGFSDLAPAGPLTLSVSSHTFTLSLPEGGVATAVRIAGPDALVGAWLKNGSDVANGRFTVTAFLPDHTYYLVQEGPAEGGGFTGVERGTYTWNPTTGAFTSAALVDRNGAWGLNSGSQTLTITNDVLNGTSSRVKGQPLLSWSDPGPIRQGVPLGSGQLNAAADVPGTFEYSVSSGAVLPAGVTVVNATFRPADPVAFAGGAAVQAVITVIPPGVTHWAAAYFTPAEQTNAAISGPLADPNQDGAPNLVHYAFGVAPDAPVDALLPEPEVQTLVSPPGDYLTFDVTLPDPLLPDVRYGLLQSSDLLTWTALDLATHTVSTTRNGDGTQRVVVRAEDPTSAGAGRYLRFTVSLTP